MSADPAESSEVQRIRAVASRACVILAGSTGSGEATRTPDGATLSDLEVAVVGWCGALQAARRTRREEPEIEAFYVAPWRMRLGMERNIGVPRPNLPAFDLVRQRRVGELPRAARPPRVWQATDLTRREAITLVNNRIGEYVEVRTHYSRVKLAVAVADAALIAMHEFVPGYGQRAEVFGGLTNEVTPAVAEVGDIGYRSKLSGVLEPLPVEALAAAARDLLTRHLGVPARDLSWPGLYGAFRDAWADDARRAGWGPAARAVDRFARLRRAKQRVPKQRAVAVARRWPQPDAAVYAALTSVLLTGQLDCSVGPSPLPDDVPHDLAADVDELLALWRAFCK